MIYKRRPYEFEHEVRLALWPQPLIQAAGVSTDPEWIDRVSDLAPAGYDVGFDPATLIQAVVVAPQAPSWSVELIRSLAKRYDLDAPVVRSDLDAEPM